MKHLVNGRLLVDQWTSDPWPPESRSGPVTRILVTGRGARADHSTEGKPMSTTDDRNDPGLREIGPDGMQDTYLVLSDEERAKGFVRPVHRSYRHLTCGAVTTMGQAIAETYARSPGFYGGTFCARCRAHFPVGPDGEFVWDGTDEKVGT